MSRTVFTVEDVKNIVESLFNGNLRAYRATNGVVPYNNPNSEQILLIDEESGEQEQQDLAQYLNIDFYVWRNRLVEKQSHGAGVQAQALTPYDTWVQSLNFSMNEAYALVETTDMEVTASQDIDNATINARITFLIQTNKITNLDYYLSKIRNSLLGVPQQIQNSYGEIVTSYILLGSLLYDEEPTTTQNGEIIVVSCNFRISYLTDAETYNDTKIEISFNGDDLYNENGEIVDEAGQPTTTKYQTMPLTRYTWQKMFGENPLPVSARPDLSGFVATAIQNVKTLTFYDFKNKTLTEQFNALFWQCGAYRIDGTLSSITEPNVPVYIKITNGGHFYIYKDMISTMQKNFTNNDFVISSITLKGWGKIE